MESYVKIEEHDGTHWIVEAYGPGTGNMAGKKLDSVLPLFSPDFWSVGSKVRMLIGQIVRSGQPDNIVVDFKEE
jgi:hypothetical protein